MPQPTLKVNINDAKLKMPTFQLKVFETALNCNDSSTETTARKQPIESKKKLLALQLSKSAPTEGAKGRVFPEALTQSALAGGGGGPFLAGKMHGTFIKHRNLQHFGAQTVCTSFWCYNFAAKIATSKMWNLGAV